MVGTQEGIVKGFISNGVAQFLGIPYTAPPVGNLRWKPPKKHEPWAGVLKATSFGSNCPQNQNHIFAGPANPVDEDCLFLNVFTPDLDPSARKASGHFLDPRRRQLRWARARITTRPSSPRTAKTVVVTINYRLGSLGWLAVPALDAEGHLFGNYGLLDQQFALKWVRRNIAKFGGDKDNVTLGGQSAGSFDVEGNMVSPLSAKGMFHRAILESLVTEPQIVGDCRSRRRDFCRRRQLRRGTRLYHQC